MPVSRAGNSLIAEFLLPSDCGNYYLIATGRRADDPATFLRRDLPEATVIYRSPGAVEPDIYSWKKLQVELTPRITDYAVFGQDPEHYTYRVLATGTSVDGDRALQP